MSLLFEQWNLSRWRAELAAIRVELRERRLSCSTIKAGFREEQPRNELGRWTLESGVEVSTSTGFFTGIAEIDETSVALSDTLARVMGALEYLPKMSPALYGTAVHIAFGVALRLQGLPGVGDIERSFSLDTVDPYYGLAGTIRTDATLRNVQGDIIAIYDVKTGAQTISRARADELRAKTQAAPDTPVFELNVVRGISRKQIVLSIFRSRSRARPITRGI